MMTPGYKVRGTARFPFVEKVFEKDLNLNQRDESPN
jgi:hypothetical protein